MEPKSNLLERAISFFSPKLAYERTQARFMSEVMNLQRKYVAAGRGPLTEDWHTYGTSANTEINADILSLRNRMRDLVRNDGWANTAVKALANNVVGKGIQPALSSPEGSEKLKENVEKLFMQWCKSIQSDFYGKLNFFGQQRLVVRSLSESGDVIILKRYTGKGRKMRLTPMILEADFLVHWYCCEEVSGFPKGTRVENGVYFDAESRVIGYELYNSHPGDRYGQNSLDHFFISREDCILLFRVDRPGQQRGVPEAASVMLDHKMLAQYELAQQHKQTVSAMFALYIKSQSVNTFGAGGKPDTGKYKNFAGERIAPGTIQYLLPGEDIQPSNPPTTDGYDEYTSARLRKISKGWGLTYAVVSGDLKGASFSSERMGWIEMHRNIESFQYITMIPEYCTTIWQWWTELEQLKGTIPLDLSNLFIDWTPPRREMLDPVKETKALIDQILSGIKSYAEAIREFGGDPDKVMNEIAAYNKKITNLNLVLASDYRNIHEEKMKGSGDIANAKPAKTKSKKKEPA